MVFYNHYSRKQSDPTTCFYLKFPKLRYTSQLPSATSLASGGDFLIPSVQQIALKEINDLLGSKEPQTDYFLPPPFDL
jgi:hypothetical protein